MDRELIEEARADLLRRHLGANETSESHAEAGHVQEAQDGVGLARRHVRGAVQDDVGRSVGIVT